MSEKQNRVLEVLQQTLPHMSPETQSYLLGFGEGVAAAQKKLEPEDNKSA